MSPSTKAPAGHFTILYFASASSHTSKSSEFLAAPLPISKLFPKLEDQYQDFKVKILNTSLVTINLEYVDVPDTPTQDEIVIMEGDEVAIIPPVSSG